VAVLVSVVVAGAITTISFAGEGDDRDDGNSVPGVPVVGGGSSDAAPSTPSGDGTYAPIVTGNIFTTFESSILTKFIPASAFTGDTGDILAYDSVYVCADATASPAGTHTLRAPIELPDGSRIKRITAFGSDTDAGNNMTIYLDKAVYAVPFLGVGSITESNVVNFTTSAASGFFAISNPTDLNEVTGNGGFLSSFDSFYDLYVQMPTAAGENHSFCGVEVTYQVPSYSTADSQAFYPISPIRAFDSRIAGYAPNNTAFAPSTSRVISIKDGHDSAGAVNLTDAVPFGATAVTYNITVTGPTGPNFLAVTAGDATGFTASAINFNGTADIANGGTVSIPFDRTIKVWCGDQTGSTNVIIDITGYYAPIPNMGN
jgi:hypothetical protein